MSDHTQSHNERIVEARVRNWGIAVRGGLPGAPIPEEEAKDPDLLDAEIIERGMVEMRRARKHHFKVMKYLYVRGRSDQEAANYFGREEQWVADMTCEGVRWLINYLELRVKEVA